jgi:kinesin family protein C1
MQQKSYFPFIFQYEFEGSFLEIYNETIRDLLGNQEGAKHEIKIANNDVTVTNLTTVQITSEDQVI